MENQDLLVLVQYVEKRKLKDTKDTYTIIVKVYVMEDLEKEFVDYIEQLAREAMENAELELLKMKETKEVLDLPPRKENWSAQENAEENMEERMTKLYSYLQKVSILTKGLEVFRNGMIYNAMKSSKKVK